MKKLLLLSLLLIFIPRCFSQDPCSASSNLIVGYENPQIYKTVIATEHSNSERTHVFPYTCNLTEIAASGNPLTTYNRTSETLGTMYNTITRQRDELFIYGGCFGGTTNPGDNTGSWIVKLNANTLETEWKTKLINTEVGEANYEEWNYPGVLGMNGDGFLYAVYGYRFSKLDTSGNIINTITLPVGAGQLPKNTSYNGFTIMSDGFFVTKTMGRTNGCPYDGTGAFKDAAVNPSGPCAGYDTIPSYLSVINPNTMQVTQSFSLGSFSGGRITSTTFNGVNYIYLTGTDDITRYIYNSGNLTLDTTWGPVNYRLPYNQAASAIAVINDFIVLQTNGSPAPIMSVVAVSQLNATIKYRLNPFQGQSSMQWLPSMLSVDPENNRIYAMDVVSAKIAAINLTNTGLVKIYEIPTSSFSFVTLTGDSANRILATTNLPTIQGATDILQLTNGTIDFYNSPEVLSFYNAANGSLIYTTPQYSPPMNPGILVTPGFNGSFYLMGLDGKLKEVNFFDQSLNLNQIEDLSDEIKLYPNPTTGIIQLDKNNTTPEIKSISIYNSIGMMVTKELDLTSQSNGLYLVKIETDKGLLVQKIEKK